MSICKHNGCRRYLKLFNGPKRCEDCSPPLLHLILGRGRSHTPGNNDDTDVTDDNGNDGKNDSKRRTRSDVRAQQELDDARAQQELDDVRAQQELDDIRAQQELDDMNRYCCSACANFPYESGNCYEKGWGVSRDLNKAQELYTQAIGQGDVRAQQKLDDMMNRFYKPRGPGSREFVLSKKVANMIDLDRTCSSTSSPSIGSKHGHSSSSSSASSASSSSSSSSRSLERQKNQMQNNNSSKRPLDVYYVCSNCHHFPYNVGTCFRDASYCYRDGKRVVSEYDLKRQHVFNGYTQFCRICEIMANTEKEHSGQCLYEEGMEYYYGLNFKERDGNRGRSMIEASATSGYPMAVAQMKHITRPSCEPVSWEAFHVFINTEKETNGYHWAQFMIGYCYQSFPKSGAYNISFSYRSYIMTQDYTEAVKWYTKSSDQGNPAAMNFLALCYSKGKGCEQNMKTAFDLYEKLADLGYNYASYNVGICYEYGWGVTKDLNKAKEWFTKAAAQGHEKAQNKVDKIADDQEYWQRENIRAAIFIKESQQREKTLEERRQRNQIINKEKLRVGACETCGRVVTPENVVRWFKWAHRDRATWVNVFDWTLTNPKGENGLAKCGLVGIRTLVNNSEEYFQKQWPIERAKSKLSCYPCHQKETDENLNCYGIQLYVPSKEEPPREFYKNLTDAQIYLLQKYDCNYL